MKLRNETNRGPCRRFFAQINLSLEDKKKKENK